MKSLGNRLLGAVRPPAPSDRVHRRAGRRGQRLRHYRRPHRAWHTGLILLTRNESELAGVVGHEIAHILQRHQSRLYQGQGKYQLASLAALALAILASRGSSSQSGQVTEAAIVGASAIMAQGQLDYTREHEREADRVGVTMLERAGYDPRGMVSFFERMQRANRLSEFKSAPSYLRTHPLTVERIADMQGRVEPLAARLVPDSFEYRLARAEAARRIGVPRTNKWPIPQPARRPHGPAPARGSVRARPRPAAGAGIAEAEKESPRSAPAKAGTPPSSGSRPSCRPSGPHRRRPDTYRAAHKAYPQHRGLVHGLAQSLLEAGRNAEAIAWLD